ncbi:glutamate formimidoyltransferase [Pseudacidobacterium ailaaui]|jgi:glutamate formiminotransferase|uniref:glutamate formimidoyltransferase n=1 Tax=Pseudacidobacterium ailaaui TaxID=1382359 RepID=UPI00047D1C79|nr:glutamate formimidoyltransferase [Pseudacidobacterium ailaaui]MDI3256073.1 glutamate formimidoyltransferase [Bacillota bacterium]
MSEQAMSDALMECVPNFSEGRDLRKVTSIISSMHIEGVQLLDWSMDEDHNRSVVTIAGPPAAVIEAAVRAAGRAAELIDLTAQAGVHPRMGAADVIPFVPIRNLSLEQCALLARQAGAEIWKRHHVPVYFYEAAAARPDRALLEDVRRGQFEGLREAVRKDVSRRPDVGGPDLHPTAGASAVGARRYLIAYNIYLDTDHVATARAIAKEVRASSGGLSGVKAMGVLAHGLAQISMNITDFRQTSVADAYAAVKRLAARYRTRPVRGELIGLLPEGAFEPESEWVRQLDGFHPEEKILERRLQNPLQWPSQV